MILVLCWIAAVSEAGFACNGPTSSAESDAASASGIMSPLTIQHLG
jgi:hypothetical protein